LSSFLFVLLVVCFCGSVGCVQYFRLNNRQANQISVANGVTFNLEALSGTGASVNITAQAVSCGGSFMVGVSISSANEYAGFSVINGPNPTWSAEPYTASSYFSWTLPACVTVSTLHYTTSGVSSTSTPPHQIYWISNGKKRESATAFNIFNSSSTSNKRDDCGYKGCYVDNPSRDLSYYLGDGYTPETCKLACEAVQNPPSAPYGYAVAAVQYYGQCFCDNDYGAYGLASSPFECNTPCTQSPTQMCGGPWRNSVYETGWLCNVGRGFTVFSFAYQSSMQMTAGSPVSPFNFA